ncbi:hypothetical protein QZH41_006737, partial [Actinostola sp. cb2023]
MYVDDMTTGGCVKDEVLNLKKTAVTVFETTKFTLHKWHSNDPQLESDGDPKDDQQSYAKQQLGVQQEGFIAALKRFTARRGRPSKIYSDNGRSFVGAAKWLRNVMRDEVLTWKELEEVMLDVEVAINNRPLTYVEDDVQLPLLTTNLMIYGEHNLIPEMDADSLDDTVLRNRAKYLRRCKDVLWSRWTKEYVRSLRERHNLKHNTKELDLKIGDVVLIQSDERNRGKWNIGIVEKLIEGRDGV